VRQVEGAHDGFLVPAGAGVHDPAQPTPDDHIPTGDDLGAWVHVSDHHYVTGIMDVVPRSQGTVDQSGVLPSSSVSIGSSSSRRRWLRCPRSTPGQGRRQAERVSWKSPGWPQVDGATGQQIAQVPEIRRTDVPPFELERQPAP
jgi:hypothetical protein